MKFSDDIDKQDSLDIDKKLKRIGTLLNTTIPPIISDSTLDNIPTIVNGVVSSKIPEIPDTHNKGSGEIIYPSKLSEALIELSNSLTAPDSLKEGLVIPERLINKDSGETIQHAILSKCVEMSSYLKDMVQSKEKKKWYCLIGRDTSGNIKDIEIEER